MFGRVSLVPLSAFELVSQWRNKNRIHWPFSKFCAYYGLPSVSGNAGTQLFWLFEEDLPPNAPLQSAVVFHIHNHWLSAFMAWRMRNAIGVQLSASLRLAYEFSITFIFRYDIYFLYVLWVCVLFQTSVLSIWPIFSVACAIQPFDYAVCFVFFCFFFFSLRCIERD